MDSARRRSSLYDGDGPDEPRRNVTRTVVVSLAVIALVVAGAVAAVLISRDDGAQRASPDASVPVTDASSEDLSPAAVERVTAEGLTVRLHVSDNPDVVGQQPPPAAGAPAWCEATGMAFGTVISDLAVAQSQMAVSKVAAPNGGGQLLMGGVLEGSPMWGVVVQVPPQIALVRASLPGVEPDEMEPVDGVAIVALPAPARPVGAAPIPNRVDPWGIGIDLGRAKVEFVSASGHSETFDVSTDFMGPAMWNDQRCWPQAFPQGEPEPAPPPVLPDPGEQPADAVAAEAAVAGALGELYAAPIEEGREFFDLIDDASGIDLNVASSLKDQPELRNLLTKGDATISELVFISPIEAFFVYDLDAPYGPVVNRFGRARFVDGRWKITRGTFCQETLPYGVICGV
ncbi:MAG: hypothetical protein WCC60_08755 [Ilumatobacteraceae bacterium]